MQKILFATNFSDYCTNAFEYVKACFAEQAVSIDLIHVYNIPVQSLTYLPADVASQILDNKKEEVEALLQQLMEQLPTEKRGDIHAVYGIYPSSDIADEANTIDADLVVMALRQKYTYMGRIIGSVTAHTIHKSKAPVLAIPTGAKFRQMKHILFPTAMKYGDEMIEEEEKALDWLFDFSAKYKDMTIEMLHITPDYGLDIFHKNKPLPDITFRTSHARTVEEGIVQTMLNNDFDLLAFYKPHRSYWERLYHSSVSRKLLLQSYLPLLIFS